jgi:rRNA maturation endonuclease Nob1
MIVLMILSLATPLMTDPPAEKKRTEYEWLCPRCRKAAEGSYCQRCGNPYERPSK